MNDIIVGLIALGLGLAVAFLGLRLWFVMLPIWGFFTGFYVGAAAIEALTGDGFLSTVTGWVVGAIIGIGFAIVSYVFWYVGALIAAGAVGASLVTAIMAGFGVDDGWFLSLMALVGAFIAVVVAFLLALPIYLVVISTAIAGATGAVTGIMLILNRIEVEGLQNGAGWTMVTESWFWFIVMMVIATIGLGAQLSMMSQTRLPEERWGRAAPAV
ncbi:MAG TPA: DUF4203 domain-containing protein [Thermomicrobiales bacterium]|jgi:hypothetical protein|nr:DUF4203 domain-containing protein [Thermomicrobiales bacterium]